jgi:hypothetical protein
MRAVAEMQLIKHAGSLRPANQTDADKLAKVKQGALVLADIRQPRNSRYHRKFMAMLDMAFDYWEPGEVTLPDGVKIEAGKDFDRFRKDVTILAGFRHPVVNIKGEVRYEADSISFSSMDEGRFNEVYKAVFGVCWRLVLRKIPGMTESVAENTINQMMAFD